MLQQKDVQPKQTSKQNQSAIALDTRLAKRGIAQAAHEMGWETLNNGWKYPIIALDGQSSTWRYKYINGRQKYAWDKSHGKNNCDYYFAADIIDAIAKADGVLYIAAGEIDLLTYLSAGIRNVIAWFGETSVPKTLANDLHTLGVSRVIYAPDNDKTGVKSAIKVRDALRETGIDFEALDLSAIVGKKGDTNDLWCAVKFKSQLFRAVLDNAPTLKLPAPVEKTNSASARNFDDSELQDIQNKLNRANLEQLEQQGNLKRHVSDGWQQTICPCHDDHNASAAINLESGVLHCFATGESYSPVRVAELLGIDWRQFYPSRPIKRSRVEDENIKDYPIDEWAEPVPLAPLSDSKKVELEYISDIDLAKVQHRTLLIKSPLGTGKTELITRIIQQRDTELGREARVLIITNRIALVENLAERLSDLDFDTYLSVPKGEKVPFTRVITTIDSLHTLSHDEFDIVISDENETNLPTLATSGTMKSDELERAYNEMRRRVQLAGQFIGLDAHMSDKSRAIIRAWRGDVHCIENIFVPERGKMTIYQHQEKVIADAMAKARRSKKTVVITTNSRANSYLYYDIFSEEFGANNVRVINGDNSASEDNRAFLKNINQSIQTVRVLIVSPSLQNGFDITTPVAGVFGVFLNHMPATDIMQMMMRCRNADEYNLYVAPVFDGTAETDYRRILALQLHQAKGTADAANFADFGLEVATNPQKTLGKIAAVFKAEYNRQRNNLFSYTVAYAQAEGFTIAYNDDEAEHMRSRLKKARANYKASKMHDTLTLDPIDGEQYNALRQLGKITRTEKHQYLRYNIEFTSGQKITGELYDLLETNKDRTAFNRFVDLFEKEDKLHRRDRIEAGEILERRQHYSKTMEVIISAMTTVFGEDWENNEEQLTEEEITKRISPWLEENYADVVTYIDKRSDLSKKPLAIFRRILKACKLKLRGKQIRNGDEPRIYIYWLDREHTTRLRQLAAIALLARREREINNGNFVLKHVSIVTDIRNLRQPDDDEIILLPDEGVIVTISGGQVIRIPF